MSNIWQMILTSGVFSLVMTLVVTWVVNSGFKKIEHWQHVKTDETFLMMEKMDKMGALTVLMANKLHEAGIINGDLEELKKDYKAADAEYDKHIKQLAAEVLRR